MIRFVILFLMMPVWAFTQGYDYRQSIVQSSPNAASLEKFIEYPVNYYTGVPQIGVDLYNIQLKALNIPISISYHASGNKVADIASNIGLGWSLQAGGVVQIHPNGMMDELSGFSNTHVKYSEIRSLSLRSDYREILVNCESLSPFQNPGGTDISDLSYLAGIHHGIDDSEPDLYTYSYLNRNGKFFQDESGVYRTIPFSKQKIERISNVGYKITDTEGNIYEFSAKEENQISQSNNCNQTLAFNSSIGLSNNYYLTRITTPFNEIVTFTYSEHSNSIQKPAEYTRAKFLNPNGLCGQFNAVGGIYYQCTKTITSESDNLRLNSISSSNGLSITFSYSNIVRQDLPASYALEDVIVSYIPTNSIIKQFHFVHDYWSGRLRLTSVQENGKPPFQFSYDQQNILPVPNSYSVDHWGYYNGKPNTTLLPADVDRELTGADRNPDFTYTKAGILNKVTYPTGGTTEYQYEPNMYYNSEEYSRYIPANGGTLLSSGNSTTNLAFVVPANGNDFKITYSNTYSSSEIHNDYCHIILNGPNGYVRQFFQSGFNIIELLETLSPGNYTISIETEGNSFSGSATISWKNQIVIPPGNEIGGGIRVKQITSKDNLTNIDIERKFEYNRVDNGFSSGTAMNFPTYVEYKSAQKANPGGGILPCDYLIQQSSSFNSQTFSNGYHVGYSDVIVYTKSRQENGYTHYTYIIDENSSTGNSSNTPYTPQINYDWVNGSLISQVDYKYENAQFYKIKSLKNTYNYIMFNPQIISINDHIGYGNKVAVLEDPACLTSNAGPIFGISLYKYFSSWHYLISTADTIFQGNTFSTNFTNYDYNPSHLLPTLITKGNSRREKTYTFIKYPLDYEQTTIFNDITKGINYLKSKNIISPVIETGEGISNFDESNLRITKGEFYTYHENFPIPKNIKSLENTPLFDFQPSKTTSGNITFDSRYKDFYSINIDVTNGNIAEKRKTFDYPTAYLWGNDNLIPIAQCINATSSQIAYTSFENQDLGGWNVNSGGRLLDTDAPTGKYRYSGNATSPILPAGTYLVTLFGKTLNSQTINGSVGKDLFTYNSWTLRKWEIPLAFPNAIQIQGSNYDEVRIYPKGGQMTTYTYNPFVGVTSICDPAGKVQLFEYDQNGRLKTVRDIKRNILKGFDYKYQQ